MSIPSGILSKFESQIEKLQNADFPFVIEEDNTVSK